ncbi:sensor histidine kinase [Phenylobacterium sp.]|uniref:sensor histidine kinase n=1 Tax=Phenylobacterium sp. TaxID=1871053 RepID=UPI002F3FB31C
MDAPAELYSVDLDHLGLAGPARGRPSADERRELDHRLANSLQLAADFLLFEQARVTDPVANAALLQAASRLSTVAQLHRFLSDHEEMRDVNLGPFLGELCRLVEDGTGLECTVDAEPVTVPGGVAQQLAIAINELAMNAAKHAYRKGERGGLHVDCRRDGLALRLTVSDHGEGLRQDFSAEQATGLGMSILKAVVRQLRGSLEAHNDHGAKFTITMPLPQVRTLAQARSFSPRA